MLLSIFGARLVQLQGVDPHSYAVAAAAEGSVEAVLPATRGSILDRTGEPLATSVDGLMVVADPSQTVDQAPALATFLVKQLGLDYVDTLAALTKPDRKFAYVARRVPATEATAAVDAAKEAGFKGLATRLDPVRDYPAGDVAANVVGYMGAVGQPLGGLEMTFDKQLAGVDGSETYQVGAGNRLPLGENSRVEPTDGTNLETTLDRDVSWYTQKVLAQTVESSNAKSGMAVVMDTKTGELLALADYPTFDAADPFSSPQKHRGAPSVSDPIEPGSVEKALTMASLLDAGKVTPETVISVPDSIDVMGQTINDYFEHPTMRLTLTGVLAKSSNVGTLMAASKLSSQRLKKYLESFGLGSTTDIGVRGESAGLLPDSSNWNELSKSTIAFGQGLATTGVQMAAAINAVANDGVYISPSLIRGSATTDSGTKVGTDQTTSHRVVSEQTASEVAQMMERVLDPEEGVAPGAAVPGYRVAGKTGTAQFVDPKCKCYVDGAYNVSFAGFAPADDPRFTVYVVVKQPGNGQGGGALAGPAFSKIMSYVLSKYGVLPTGTPPSKLPILAPAKPSAKAPAKSKTSTADR